MRIVFRTLTVSLILSSQLAAQQPDPSGLLFEAHLGYREPTAELGRTGVVGGGYVAFEEPEGMPVLGLGVVGRLAGPFHLRIRADYAAEAGVSGQWFCDAFTPCPAVLILVDGRLTQWTFGGDLQYRPQLPGWPFAPRLLLGASRRAYRVRWESELPEVPIPTEYETSSNGFHVGVGGSRQVGALSLFAEAEAIFGSFGVDRPLFIEGVQPPDAIGPAPTQVDLGLALGASIRIR